VLEKYVLIMDGLYDVRIQRTVRRVW